MRSWMKRGKRMLMPRSGCTRPTAACDAGRRTFPKYESYAWLPNTIRISYYACQIGPGASYSFQLWGSRWVLDWLGNPKIGHRVRGAATAMAVRSHHWKTYIPFEKRWCDLKAWKL
jgi:hypothetical protein